MANCIKPMYFLWYFWYQFYIFLFSLLHWRMRIRKTNFASSSKPWWPQARLVECRFQQTIKQINKNWNWVKLKLKLEIFQLSNFSDFCKCGAGKPNGEGEVGFQANENCRHFQSCSVWSSAQVKNQIVDIKISTMMIVFQNKNYSQKWKCWINGWKLLIAPCETPLRLYCELNCKLTIENKCLQIGESSNR